MTKSIFFAISFVTVSSTLSALTTSASFTALNQAGIISNDCKSCLDKNTPAVEKLKTACLTSKVKPDQAFGDKLTQIEACSQENLLAFSKLCAAECDPKTKN